MYTLLRRTFLRPYGAFLSVRLQIRPGMERYRKGFGKAKELPGCTITGFQYVSGNESDDAAL